MIFFFFNDTATTEIYTLSLHDALPIFGHDTSDTPSICDSAAKSSVKEKLIAGVPDIEGTARKIKTSAATRDRKSTRLNSSHSQISYAVFCLKKKKPY